MCPARDQLTTCPTFAVNAFSKQCRGRAVQLVHATMMSHGLISSCLSVTTNPCRRILFSLILNPRLADGGQGPGTSPPTNDIAGMGGNLWGHQPFQGRGRKAEKSFSNDNSARGLYFCSPWLWPLLLRGVNNDEYRRRRWFGNILTQMPDDQNRSIPTIRAPINGIWRCSARAGAMTSLLGTLGLQPNPVTSRPPPHIFSLPLRN